MRMWVESEQRITMLVSFVLECYDWWEQEREIHPPRVWKGFSSRHACAQYDATPFSCRRLSAHGDEIKKL